MSDPTATKHLLLDSRIISHAENVGLTLGSVEKEPHNPLFVEDKPWEVRYDNLYPNVIFDEEDGIYKAWYNPFIVDAVTSSTPPAERVSAPYKPREPREMGICYATSHDGIVWEKPDLGIIEFNGASRNNLVMRHIHGAGVTKDMHDPDPAQRYKGFMEGGVATSPDGLHWTDVMLCPEIEAVWDTHNNLFWDDRQGKYVGFTRLWEGRERIVGRTESRDLRHWSKAAEVMRALPDEPHRQTYTLLVFPYGNVYLGLVMLLDMTAADTVDCELAWSTDTVNWERVCPGTPLIPRGPGGSFDSGCIYAAAYPILREGRIRLYYGGGNGAHMSWRVGGFGLATLRPDGFAGMEPVKAGDVGVITTEPVECTGDQLLVSADAAGGTLRASVVDAEGLGLDDRDIIAADVTDGIVRWRDGRDLSALSGQRVRLRFELRSATLYAFDFGG